MDAGPFRDSHSFGDDLWDLMGHHNARTEAEAHLIRVMLFHGDFLNGGLNQVMYNIKEAAGEKISDYVQSFEALGLKPFALVIALADSQVHVGKGWQSVFNRPSAELDDVYTAMTMGLPWTDTERFEEFLDDDERATDWVVKAALKYARDNIGEFTHLISLWNERKASGPLQGPIPKIWREALKNVADAFVEGRIPTGDGIRPIDAGAAKVSFQNIEDYPDKIGPLNDLAWRSSVRMWMDDHWQVLIDLSTVDGARSDLVLHAKVFTQGDRIEIEPGLVYVP